ncbi:MAG: tetratricopeptide repeat protein, partial [Luminiphilus sp.]|nr:tetratricopeptide repeat protein [Luminiphilus sp.]
MADALQALLKRGFDALNRGDPQTAAELCREALDQAPELPQAHFLVGLVALETEDRPNAHRAFRTVVKLDPDNAAAWAQLARLNASEGRVVPAEQALLETRRLKPTDPAILDTIGTVLNQMGEYEAAKAFFARANTAAPRTPQY